jgi:hypothetical protein
MVRTEAPAEGESRRTTATPRDLQQPRQSSTLLLVPGGKCATVMDSPVSSASLCNSVFHRRTRAPLLPPQSAVIRIWRAVS